MEEYITLRSVQQFYYCPHRWGLMQINSDWASNYFVAQGDILHENVNIKELIKIGDKYQCKSLSVFNEDYGIFGIVDVLELRKSKKGVRIESLNDNFDLEIVEYKNTFGKKQKLDDLLQVYGQKLCVDKMFGCDSKVCFYYNDTKRRCNVVITEIIKQEFGNTLREIEEYSKKNEIPEIKKGQKCSGCSLENICIPIKRKTKTFMEMAKTTNEEITKYTLCDK
ncbi:MAG: CRISPR-associated protein Cas4 [Clostridia bacterium]